jgi:hypothetical protein
MVGTADAVGKMLGFTSGTRVSDWKQARGGRPSLESCLKLAKITDDDPIDVLTMAGHDEAVQLLTDFFRHKTTAPAAVLLQPKNAINSAIEALLFAKQQLEEK